MEIKVPKRLNDKLAEDSEVIGQVITTLARFSRWFESSGTPFFRQYTDHGSKHISEVLETAEQLIAEPAWDCLTSRDAAVLVLAALLHDATMHLQEDGFLLVVSGNWPTNRISMLDSEKWLELWDDYLAQAKRFDRRHLKEIFGVEEPILPPDLKHPERWTAVQFDFIGEFLRRNHPRLAHEIALCGVPGPGTNPLGLGDLDPAIADLAGIVARSHGGPLRASLPYIQNRYHLQDFAGIHAPFLMAVLRVADYLQLQAGRAPKEVLQVKSLRSPTSRREWKVHHAIRNITYNDPDPEAVRVQLDAKKTDLKTFLRLREWFQGIQTELDVCWATLGEVYGRYAKDHLDQLGLSIRRIRSDLDDPKAFAKQITYIPDRIAFSTADAELLQLLIQPLYGEQPEVGIRELIQNAVDAVRELEDYSVRHVIARESLDLVRQDADVVVELNVPSKTLKVSDRGIGMTVATVRDYFLKAGASFRKSDAWRAEHESKPGDSRVLRSGRFGVGALAAFLLGNTIHVTTRNVKESSGVSFTARLIDDALELSPMDCEIGTTITVELSDYALEILTLETKYQSSKVKQFGGWDWYCLTKPTVTRKILPHKGEPTIVPQAHQWPGLKADLPPTWRRLEVNVYADVHWSYKDLPALVCNGIRIGNPPRPDGFSEDVRSKDEWYLKLFHCPTISVFDPNGVLPLTLTREKLSTDRLSFDPILQKEVMKDFLAYCIATAPSTSLDASGAEPFINYPGFTPQRRGIWSYRGKPNKAPVWLRTIDGAMLADGYLVQAAGLTTIVMFSPPDGKKTTWCESLSNVPHLHIRAGHEADWSPTMRGMVYGWHTSAGAGFCGIPFIGARLLVDAYTATEWNKPGKLDAEHRSRLNEKKLSKDWVLWTFGSCDAKTSIPLEQIVAEKDVPYFRDEVFLAEKFVSPTKIEGECSELVKAWFDLIGPHPIPYRREDRRAKLPRAYAEIGDYIDRWEKQLTESQDRKRKRNS